MPQKVDVSVDVDVAVDVDVVSFMTGFPSGLKWSFMPKTSDGRPQ
jgi:hypothetical protein